MDFSTPFFFKLDRKTDACPNHSNDEEEGAYDGDEDDDDRDNSGEEKMEVRKKYEKTGTGLQVLPSFCFTLLQRYKRYQTKLKK